MLWRLLKNEQLISPIKDPDKKQLMIATELKRLIGCIKECDVSYMLVDSFAYAPNTSLKLGKDIDFWIKPSLDNARKIMNDSLRSISGGIPRIAQF